MVLANNFYASRCAETAGEQEKNGSGKNENKKRTYICIDLKSFFASVECVERGLDPFKANLVVADPDRGEGTICLAVSPAMKALGVPGRCRIFEIPKCIEYIKARPRMQLYLDKSSEIFGIYLQRVCPDDLHVYSVDECFIDATDYLRLYKRSARGFAELLKRDVFEQTGICASVGIGPNIFLCKAALDVLAKHDPDNIAELDEDSFREKLWDHRPITDIWNIGPGTARRLERFGVYDLRGVAHLPPELLFRTFGVNARQLIDHANGRDFCTIAQIKAFVPKSTSISNSQVLFSDYDFEDARLILAEMVDMLSLELVRRGFAACSVALYVGYSGKRDHKGRTEGGGEARTAKLPEATSSYRKLSEKFDALYCETVDRGTPIRQIGISFGGLIRECDKPITIFTDTGELLAEEKEYSLMKTIVKLQNSFGKNAVLRGRDFEKRATLRERNRMIGGHSAEARPTV